MIFSTLEADNLFGLAKIWYRASEKALSEGTLEELTLFLQFYLDFQIFQLELIFFAVRVKIFF